MRYLFGIIAASVFAVSSPAFAEDKNTPHTLDGQMQKMQQQQNAPAATAVAPGELIESEGNGAIPALPLNVRNAGNITYITGGIGDEELAQLKSRSHDFNTHLLLTTASGEYISDVTVNVTDSKGAQVFSAEDLGPYVYFSLPPGGYTIEATSKASASVKKGKLAVPTKGFVSKQFVYKE